jgi:hypothetical protein
VRLVPGDGEAEIKAARVTSNRNPAAGEVWEPGVWQPYRRTADRVKSEPGPAATLGSTAAAGVRIIVWCKACGHQTEPDPATMAERYRVHVPVLVWRGRLSCSRCGGREIDMVLSGQRR